MPFHRRGAETAENAEHNFSLRLCGERCIYLKQPPVLSLLQKIHPFMQLIELPEMAAIGAKAVRYCI
jgi:hypothetical protein